MGSSPGVARASCWSITQFVPTDRSDDVAWSQEFMKRPLAPGWKLEGQLEKCPETGRMHIQAILNTPQVRFSAVKKDFPQAHIEPAKSKAALAAYVQKEDTRASALDSSPQTPTLWEFHDIVADKWDDAKWSLLKSQVSFEDCMKGKLDDYALMFVDKIVGDLIEDGVRGAEFMGVNPMFRSAWKKYWKNIINRRKKISAQNITNVTYGDAQAPLLQEAQGCEAPACEGSEEVSEDLHL